VGHGRERGNGGDIMGENGSREMETVWEKAAVGMETGMEKKTIQKRTVETEKTVEGT
jgi:hypothetical protein